MPAVLHTSAKMASRKVALISQNFTEDDRGLVSASLKFVAKASDRSAVDAMFYTDAPPPIWPTYLERGRLIGRNLFMQSRTLSEEYGLLTIDALFVGGRERIAPVITSDFESSISYAEESAPFTLQHYDPVKKQILSVVVIFSTSYTYTPIIQSLSFVRVGAIDSFAPSKPASQEMYNLVAYSSRRTKFGQNSELINYEYPRQYFLDLINSKAVIEDRKIETLTPTVKIVSVRYSLSS